MKTIELPAPTSRVQAALVPIVESVVAALESGNAPWVKPWAAGPGGGHPRNYVTRRRYSGVNLWALTITAWARGFQTPEWATYKQWAALGAQVRKGERATAVVLYKRVEVKDKNILGPDGKPVRSNIYIAKAFHVFNLAQVDNAPPSKVQPAAPPSPNPDGRNAEAEALWSEYLTARSEGLTFAEGGDSAYYSPSRHHVQLPEFGAFRDAGGYYATLFHEAAHSSGSERLLARDDIANRDGHSYAREELTAELTAALLMGELGIGGVTEAQNTVSYCAGWASRIKADPACFVKAASLAEKAFALITGTGTAPEADAE